MQNKIFMLVISLIGQAVKEMFFTSEGDTVYAILPLRSDGKIRIQNMLASKNTDISLCGCAEKAIRKKESMASKPHFLILTQTGNCPITLMLSE